MPGLIPSNESDWPPGTPERAVLDVFVAFRRRDVARLVELATPASLRALAARAEPEFDGDAATIIGRLVTSFPQFLTDGVQCRVVGRAVESRLADGDPDGTGRWLECRVAGGGDEWVSAEGSREINGAIGERSADVAYVLLRPAFQFPGKDVVPIPCEAQIATTQLVGGEWKLILDDASGPAGLPGFSGVGIWMDPLDA